MDYEIKTMAHRWAPGWIKKNWDEDPTHPMWLPGEGYVRRPDVVIVKDPSLPPTQDNIKQVAEIKFDNDKWGNGQEIAYRTISGPGKLATLAPEDCACDDPDRKKKTEKLKDEVLKEDLSEALNALANKGRGGRRPRLPKNLPNLKGK